MESEPHFGFLGFRNNGLEEMLGSFDLISSGVHADAFAWRQVPGELGIVGGIAGAAAAELFFMTFHQAVGIEAVLDDS
jgi:hypothetical protein